MHCKVPFNGRIFVIPNSLFKIVLFVMKTVNYRHIAFLVCMLFVFGVQAQRQKQDSTKACSCNIAKKHKQAKLQTDKQAVKMHKDAGKKDVANFENGLLYKRSPISNL